jgi:hypothetical protein
MTDGAWERAMVSEVWPTGLLMLIVVVNRRLRRGHQVDVAVCVKHNRHARAKLEKGRGKKVYYSTTACSTTGSQ